MQSQLVCGGCRTVLLYPRRATNVSCALCNMVTPVPPTGMDMAQSICGGCLTLLMHAQGATSVRCSCCHTVNLVPATAPIPNHVAHVNCGNCQHYADVSSWSSINGLHKVIPSYASNCWEFFPSIKAIYFLGNSPFSESNRCLAESHDS